MKAKWLPISAAVIMALGSASASAVDFHGYMRSGVGISDNGGMQTLSKQKVGRLGNEDETYSEVQLGQEVYNKAGKSGKGRAGALRVRDIHHGWEFEIGTGLTDADKAEWWAWWQLGSTRPVRLVKYKYFPVGMQERPRHPVYLSWRHGMDT